MQDNIEVPDFSGDDFANDKRIQLLRAEAKAYQAMIDDSLAILEEKFHLEQSSHKNLKRFEMIRSLAATVNYSMSSKIEDRYLYVCLASYFSSVSVPRFTSAGSDLYLVGFLESRNHYPRTYIYKESIKEKLVDLVLKRDVDFRYSKRFSRNFEVLTEDRQRLHELLQLKDLNELADFPEMEVELHEHGLVFRNSRKPISLHEATKFGELITVLARAFT